MPIEIGLVVFGVVIIAFFITRKARKQYQKQPTTYYIMIFFKVKPEGLLENTKLHEIGYWYQDSDKTYRVESKIKIEEVTMLLINELNLSKDDFSIRTSSDLFVPS